MSQSPGEASPSPEQLSLPPPQRKHQQATSILGHDGEGEVYKGKKKSTTSLALAERTNRGSNASLQRRGSEQLREKRAW